MLSTYTYKLAFNSYQFSLASTSAVLVLAASLVVAVFYVRRQRKEERR
jgi:multiple sugar transport system permease protein